MYGLNFSFIELKRTFFQEMIYLLYNSNYLFKLRRQKDSSQFSVGVRFPPVQIVDFNNTISLKPAVSAPVMHVYHAVHLRIFQQRPALNNNFLEAEKKMFPRPCPRRQYSALYTTCLKDSPFENYLGDSAISHLAPIPCA
jgi:hypothetical protein